MQGFPCSGTLRDISSLYFHKEIFRDTLGLKDFVTRNWRITFRIDQTEGEFLDPDYEDYH